MATARIPLFALAHSRAGDKGDGQTLSVIAYDPADWPLLAGQVTAEAVAAHFGGLVEGAVRRFDLPNLAAFNFTLERALQGGVNLSLGLDTHGKSRSSYLLGMAITVPADHPAVARWQAFAAGAAQ